MKPRIYMDTSVIGGCMDEEFARWSRALFEEIGSNRIIAVVSDLTRMELESAPSEVREVLKAPPDEGIEHVFLEQEAVDLADSYLTEGVVGAKDRVDAQHVAIASVERVDVLTSWNFRHVVNLNRIRAFNAVNLKQGYPLLEVRTPREILHEEDI